MVGSAEPSLECFSWLDFLLLPSFYPHPLPLCYPSFLSLFHSHFLSVSAAPFAVLQAPTGQYRGWFSGEVINPRASSRGGDTARGKDGLIWWGRKSKAKERKPWSSICSNSVIWGRQGWVKASNTMGPLTPVFPMSNTQPQSYGSLLFACVCVRAHAYLLVCLYSKDSPGQRSNPSELRSCQQQGSSVKEVAAISYYRTMQSFKKWDVYLKKEEWRSMQAFNSHSLQTHSGMFGSHVTDSVNQDSL